MHVPNIPIKGEVVVSIIPEERTVEFPANRSLGELYILDQDGKTQFHGDALGPVKVPQGSHLSLYFSFDPVYGCALLSDVKADGLHSLSFLGSDVRDDELVHVGRLSGLKELDISCTQ